MGEIPLGDSSVYVVKEESMKATFSATKVVHLPAQDSGITLNIIRVPPSWIDAKKADPEKLRRRQAVTVVNDDNGRKTVCYAMGAGAVKLRANAVALDYDNRDALGIGWDAGDVNLQIRPATLVELHAYAFNHPDAMVRIANRLGYLGLVIGILGILPMLL